MTQQGSCLGISLKLRSECVVVAWKRVNVNGGRRCVKHRAVRGRRACRAMELAERSIWISLALKMMCVPCWFFKAHAFFPLKGKKYSSTASPRRAYPQDSTCLRTALCFHLISITLSIKMSL